jgi:hypothetical protein
MALAAESPQRISGAERPALVLRLLLIGGPAAIARAVAIVVINTIQAAPNWAWPHIGEKPFKRVAPFRGYRDAAASVVSVSRMIGIKAPLFHAGPCLVFAGIGCAVLSEDAGHDLFLPAAATDVFSGREISHKGDGGVAAVALTQPSSLHASVRIQSYNHQSPEAFSGKFECSHMPIIPTNRKVVGHE